jgi:uncharacterized membrane protein
VSLDGWLTLITVAVIVLALVLELYAPDIIFFAGLTEA